MRSKEKTELMGKIVEFHGKPSKMSNKIIIIVPKEFHNEFQAILNKMMKFKGQLIID